MAKKAAREFRKNKPDWSADNPYRPFPLPLTGEVSDLPWTPPSAMQTEDGLRQPRAFNPKARQRQYAHPAAARPGQRLLIADDREDYQKLILEFYQPRGYRITLATTGGMALKTFMEHPPDYFFAIVSDISMELELSGIHLMKRLHELGYRGETVLASTSFDTWFGVMLNRVTMARHGVRWLVPKKSLKRRRPCFVRCRGV